MKKTVIIFGSSTGVCEDLANRIGNALGVDNIINAGDLSADAIADADNLLLGTSTWGVGDLQDDWYNAIDIIKSANLSGKTVAVFGCGDSASFSDSFCGAMAELYNAARDVGATMVGEVSTEGYTFDDSAAVEDDKFMGLAIDEMNEPDLTDDRIAAWVEQISPALA